MKELQIDEYVNFCLLVYKFKDLSNENKFYEIIKDNQQVKEVFLNKANLENPPVRIEKHWDKVMKDA